MAAKAGYLAVVQINNTTYTTVGGLKTADLQIGTDLYDITTLAGDGWKTKLPGLADYTLKLGGNFDLSDAQQAMLQAAVITVPGLAVDWKIYPAGTGAGAPFYAGTCFIKTEGIKFDVKNEEQVSFDLEGNGAITYSTGA
jgi:predicted secreted protein